MTVALTHTEPLGRLSMSTLEQRALTLWPRLDRAALRRCRDDAHRIAALVARRTSLPPEAIHSLLVMSPVPDAEIDTWFG